MTCLCKYKNALGIPNTGIHSYRFFGLAVVDVLATILGAFFISYWFHISFLYTTICAFLLGIFFHRLFCVRTTIDLLLFP